MERGIRANLRTALEQGLEGRMSGGTGQTFLHWALCAKSAGAGQAALDSREWRCLGVGT